MDSTITELKTENGVYRYGVVTKFNIYLLMTF